MNGRSTTVKHTLAALACACALLAGHVHAADGYPMKQGLHQWNAGGGKLMLVVGTYQDTVTFRRTYSFYFKEAKAEDWNQVPVQGRKGGPSFTWDSATGGEVTLADGVVAQRADAVYFIVADKRADRGYYEKGDIFVTWNKLTLSDDAHPDEAPYQFKPVFTRKYPGSASTVDAILGRELTLQPRK